MKRSRINTIIREADAFTRSHGWRLPPFAYHSPEEMRERRAAGEMDDIVASRMGWDITDYGAGEFERK